ncbi:MAG: hypothetical protein MPW15_20170 [Candidatus Manganitrophus sp.]|nr:hypothetical protein [Candidatus Manganitrophus sp.]
MNVKADGLHERLDQMLQAHGVDNYFVFDMALPDTFGYLKKRMPFAVRLSEYEDGKHLLKYTNTVWLDAFEREWYSIADISALLNSGKRVCVVSPELHRRSHVQLWERLASVPAGLAKNLYMCTDLFEQAQEAFNVIQD